MSDLYVLDDAGNPVREPNVVVWGRWFETSVAARRVGFDEIGEWQVSTVFLGLDHGWGAPPLLYETMVFRRTGGGWEEEDVERYSTHSEALEGHQRVVEQVRRAVKETDVTGPRDA